MTEQERKYPFTIGFLTNQEKILMLKRVKEPNKDLWNGVGGKIEEGETPEEAIIREVKEEVDIDVTPEQVHFGGIVSWDSLRDGENRNSGMYAYIISVLDDVVSLQQKQISEGILEWKNKAWVMDVNNNEVVENIPHFLPPMLKEESIMCHCKYENGLLQDIQVRLLEAQK